MELNKSFNEYGKKMDIGKSINYIISNSLRLSIYNSVRERIWTSAIKWVSVRISVKDSVIASIRCVYGDR